jgi:hypothetical protein
MLPAANLLEKARSQDVIYERQEDGDQAWDDTPVITAPLWAMGAETSDALECQRQLHSLPHSSTGTALSRPAGFPGASSR